jgi:hypothetical protein
VVLSNISTIEERNMTSKHPRNMYTEDKLRPAVAAASTLGEVLTNLGLEDNPKRRTYVSLQIKALGIDGRHLRNASLLYPNEMLAAAVAESKTMVEVATRLGATPVGGTIAHLKRRIDLLGLDVSHFHQARRAAQTRPRATSQGFRREGRKLVVDEQMLRSAVQSEYTIAGVILALGLTPTGPRYRAVKTAIEALDLDVSHFRGQGHLRGTRSPQRKSPAETLVHRPDLKYRADSARIKRALLDLGVPEGCARCGIGPQWRGEPMSLQVDHINGDFRDNRRENLRLLCPNCHATTNNYCRRKRVR